MRRLLAGMLFLVLGAAAFAPAANAAEIPPTNACIRDFSKLVSEDWTNGDKKLTKKERKALEKAFAERLVEIDCISDAEPLYKKVELKPFSEECKAGAKSAEAARKSLMRPLKKLGRSWVKRLKPMNVRIRRITNRIENLRERGASVKRIRKLAQRRAAIADHKLRVTGRLARRAVPVLTPVYYRTYLTLVELASRRCLDVNDLIPDDAPGPAARVAKKYEPLFITLIFTLAAASISEEHGASASASSAQSPPQLPFINLP